MPLPHAACSLACTGGGDSLQRRTLRHIKQPQHCCFMSRVATQKRSPHSLQVMLVNAGPEDHGTSTLLCPHPTVQGKPGAGARGPCCWQGGWWQGCRCCCRSAPPRRRHTASASHPHGPSPSHAFPSFCACATAFKGRLSSEGATCILVGCF